MEFLRVNARESIERRDILENFVFMLGVLVEF
jgi:hypothetical protein